MFRSILLYVLMASLLCSCLPSLNLSKHKKSEDNVSEYDQDLSAFLPNYGSSADKKNSNSRTNVIKSPEEKISATNDTKSVDAILSQMAEANKSIKNGLGFRIQIFSGNNKADFENAKSDFYRSYPELELYEAYNQPTYRIKVGNFIRRAAAEEYLEDLKSKFGTARIIYEKIDSKKALENNK